jgi:hypothetical protein
MSAGIQIGMNAITQRLETMRLIPRRCSGQESNRKILRTDETGSCRNVELRAFRCWVIVRNPKMILEQFRHQLPDLATEFTARS